MFKLKRVLLFSNMVFTSFFCYVSIDAKSVSRLVSFNKISTICNESLVNLFTFVHDVIDEIQSKGISMSRNVNELTENCLRQTNHGPIFFSTLQFSCNQSTCRGLDGNEIDMLVTANEPKIVIQLRLGIREQKNRLMFIDSQTVKCHNSV